MDEVSNQVELARSIIRDMGSVLVAFSGGVDSALVLRMAVDELGGGAGGVIATTMLMPAGEVDEAVALARALGTEPWVLPVDISRSPQVMENRPDRCYHCKRLIFTSIVQLAGDRGFRHVVDGTHTEDHSNDRPGMRALRELGIRSPLAEAGFTKEDVRRAAKDMGLEVAGKPSSPCLATRIPFNRPLEPRLLEQVDRAEGLLRNMGYRQVRVRHHGPIARIEVDPEDLARVVEDREAIIRALMGVGFVYVVLDLKGFRSGSMTEGGDWTPSNTRDL